MSSPCSARFTALAALVLAVPGHVLVAQQYWNDDTGKATLRIATLKPLLKGEGNQFLSGTVLFGGSLRAGRTVRVEGELPIARAGFSGGTGPGASSLRFGNPYLGVRIQKEGKAVAAQVGVTIPAASDPTTSIGERANEIGALGDIDRMEAFAPKVLTVRGAVEFRRVTPTGLLIGAKLGSSLLVNTRSEAFGDKQELFADYGARVGYQGASVLATVGVSGRAWVTESDLSFSERTTHQLSGTVELRTGRIRPSVLVRLPLDDSVRETMHAVIGVGVAFTF